MSDPILDAFKSAPQPQEDAILTAFRGQVPDVRQQLEYRKENPPATVNGDPNAPRESFLEQVFPAAAHPLDAIGGFARAMNPLPALLHPTDAIQNDLDARKNAFNSIKPSTGVTDPQTGENIRNLFAALVPFFGPAMASAGRQMESTDPSERAAGFGAAVANTSGPKIAAQVAPAVASGAAAAAEAGRTALTETIPSKMSNALIGATRKYFKFGANPGEAVRGLVYNSVSELPDKLETEVIKPNATRLQSVLATDAAKTKIIDIDANIQNGFADGIAKAERDGNLSLADTLKTRMQGRIAAAHELTNGARYATPDVAYKVMKQIGDDTKWTTDAVEGTVEDAKQNAYQRLNSAIDTAVPAAVPLTRKLANALTAQKAVQAAIVNGLSANPLKGGPVRSLVGLATPAVSSRVSSFLSSMARPEAPLPETTPSPVFQPPTAPIALPAGRTPLALPPAPESPGGFITRPSVPSSGIGLPRVFPADSTEYLNRLREMGIAPPQ